MVLSSNWLNLVKSDESVKSSKKKKNDVSKKKRSTKPSAKVKKGNVEDRKGAAGVIKPKNSSKIMDMVATMNREIEKVEKERSTKRPSEASDGADSVLKQKLTEDIATNKSSRTNEVGKYIAMDCEFVGVGPEGKENALARVSIVNYYGNVVLDLFVRPEEPVTDWRTWVSGIKPHMMANAVTKQECQKQVANVLNGRILVGHSVHHDLAALMLSHPRKMIRDTSRHMPFRQKYSEGKTPSLKKLTKEVLKLDIQEGEHSSIEDARATMLLYKSDNLEFEKLHNKQFGGP